MSENRIISYSHADSLCKGTLGDDSYSSCILNNLRFLPYMNDTAEALLVNNAGIVSKGDLPYLDGKSYIKGQPIAMSDTSVRIVQKNDYGQIKFRCLDVAAKPMLPLMDLTDLGLEDKPLVVLSNIELPNTEQIESLCDPIHGYLPGIPVKCPENCDPADLDCRLESLIYNYKNYSIRLNNKYQTIVANCDTIGNLISSNGNYDNLRPKAIEAVDSMTDLLLVHDIWTSIYLSIIAITTTSDYHDLVKNIPLAVKQTFPSRTVLQAELDNLDINVIQKVISKVLPVQDWTTFQYYADLDGIASFMDSYRETENYIKIQSSYSIGLKFLNCFSYVPEVNSSNSQAFESLNSELALNFIFERYNSISITMTKIHELYTRSNESQKIKSIKANIQVYDLYEQTKWLWKDTVKVNFSNQEIYDETKVALITNASETSTQFSPVRTFVNNLTTSIQESSLDSMYMSHGNILLVNLSVLYGRLQDILGLTDSAVTEVNLGGSFKDNGRYYFANVTYAIGYGKLTNIYSIRFNGAIYTTDSITDEAGNVITGISDTGCSRYKLRFKLFPDVANNSNLKELEMYIYPGTPDQPYCPTINKYHNFNANKYSGLFTKLIQDPASESLDTALYLFKGYKPLDNTVDEIVNLGRASLNAIDLSKPDLDKNSTEAFLQKEIVSLTNSSSLIAGNVITSKDLKFYLKATLQGNLASIEESNIDTNQGLSVPEANNYPYLSMVEFIDLPLGSSFRVPEVEFLIKAEDMIS